MTNYNDVAIGELFSVTTEAGHYFLKLDDLHSVNIANGHIIRVPNDIKIYIIHQQEINVFIK